MQEADLDRVLDHEALDLPGVAKGEPVVGLLVLEAVDQGLGVVCVCVCV
jgi:hypothetical protein